MSVVRGWDFRRSCQMRGRVATNLFEMVIPQRSPEIADYNHCGFPMVRDGYFYGAGCLSWLPV